MAELSNFNRDCMAYKPTMFPLWEQEKADPVCALRSVADEEAEAQRRGEEFVLRIPAHQQGTGAFIQS